MAGVWFVTGVSIFPLSNITLGCGQPPIQRAPEDYTLGGVKYTTYLELVSSLRICGALLPLPHVFVEHGSTETIYLALLLQIIIF
jgi:hypothetical protein